MRSVEVFGAPGVGKTTIFNPVWPPRVRWDGYPTPSAWRSFVETASRLAARIEPARGDVHWLTMFNKALQKMATLHRMRCPGAYAGVGLVHRGLDLAWRLPDAGAVAEYFHAMPLPAGAISLYADEATIVARNVLRGVKQPGRELSRLAPMMEAPRRMAVDILRARGVHVLELDTRNDIDANRASAVAFVSGVDAAPVACHG